MNDTSHYSHDGKTLLLRQLLFQPIITPLNSLLYNTSPENLALHGTHPRYQHLLANLPLLIGPATILLLTSPLPNLRLYSAISGILILSYFTHQEARFLLPAVPLILSSIRLPASKTLTQIFIAAWIIFNLTLGVLMGIYHQGGVIPMQLWLGEHLPPPTTPSQSSSNPTFPNPLQNFNLNPSDHELTILWWKTYSPPIWLLGEPLPLDESVPELKTIDLMGSPVNDMLTSVSTAIGPCSAGNNKSRNVIVVAPASAQALDVYINRDRDRDKDRDRDTAIAAELEPYPPANLKIKNDLSWDVIHTHRQHLNLDDLDIPREGLWGTLRRVCGRRGLVAWKVGRICHGGDDNNNNV